MVGCWDWRKPSVLEELRQPSWAEHWCLFVIWTIDKLTVQYDNWGRDRSRVLYPEVQDLAMHAGYAFKVPCTAACHRVCL